MKALDNIRANTIKSEIHQLLFELDDLYREAMTENPVAKSRSRNQVGKVRAQVYRLPATLDEAAKL